MQDDQCFFLTLCNLFLYIPSWSPHNNNSQVADLLPLGFLFYFIRGGGELFRPLFFCFSQDNIKIKNRVFPFFLSSSLCECNARTVRFLFFLKCFIEGCLFSNYV